MSEPTNTKNETPDWNLYQAKVIQSDCGRWIAEVSTEDGLSRLHVGKDKGSKLFDSFEEAYNEAQEALLMLRQVDFD